MISRLGLMMFISLVLPFAACAEDTQSKFVEGTHYQRFSQPIAVDSDKIQVLEFFKYTCPHCKAFDPYFEKWKSKQPDSIEVKQVPSVMNQNEVIWAKAFYAAQELGVLDKVHHAIFTAIHDKRQPINTEEAIAALVKGLGIDDQKFLEVMRSFQVDSEMRGAMQLMRRYRVRGVPAVAVNGHYLASSGTVGGYPELIELVDYLVAKETAAAKSK